MRKDISFHARAKSAVYDDPSACRTVELENGTQAVANILISATGPLSAPQMPNIPGVSDFQGEAYHTGMWPRDSNDYGPATICFEAKRVGVLGTGATGVQVIQEVIKSASQLLVFQRTLN